jgi:hypothetical protein
MAAWKTHKLVCNDLKREIKDVKKGRKENAEDTTAGAAPRFSISEASGTGSCNFCYDKKLLSYIIYSGELRGGEEPGQHFATEAAKQSIQNFFGEDKFRIFSSKMAEKSIEERGTFRRMEYFKNVEELSNIDQFLVSCGPLPSLELAKYTLPFVMHQISISGSKPDGSKPNIGDITVRGYGLNALEWASRRGNFEIAEWLATDVRTKIMLTRKDSAPVAWAVYTNKIELAKMLVSHGANSHATHVVVFNSKPPTHLAAENGQLLAVKYLVEECGHEISERDRLGQNIRTSLRRNCKNWMELPGQVAVDKYAKSKGVREYS